MVKQATCISTMVIVILTALPASAALVDSINADKEGDPMPWGVFPGVTEIGWLYTPTTNYSLTEIAAKFGNRSTPAPPINLGVTLEIYDELPSLGGVMQRSEIFTFTGWNPHGVFWSVSFDPLDFVAGEDYFIGFRNVFYMGKNSSSTGTALPCYGTFAEFGIIISPGTYSDQISQTSCVHPILKFYGTPIPEPAAFLLFGLGALALRRRR